VPAAWDTPAAETAEWQTGEARVPPAAAAAPHAIDTNIDIDNEAGVFGIAFEDGDGDGDRYDISETGGTIDEFNQRFCTNMESIPFELFMLRGDYAFAWIENEFSREEMRAAPALYRAIRDWNITREEFIVINDEAYGGEKYAPHIIEALFEDDITEMMRVLVHENALFYDGEIYTLREIADKTAEELSGLGIPLEVLLDFTNELIAEFEEEQETWGTQFPEVFASASHKIQWIAGIIENINRANVR
jgi:hypothetical protein